MARSHSSGDLKGQNILVIGQICKWVYCTKKSGKEGEKFDKSKKQHVEISLKKESTVAAHNSPNSILKAMIQYHTGSNWVWTNALLPSAILTQPSAASSPATVFCVSNANTTPRVFFWLKRQDDHQKDRLCFHFGSPILFASKPFIIIKVFYIQDDTQYVQFTIQKKFRQVNARLHTQLCATKNVSKFINCLF